MKATLTIRGNQVNGYTAICQLPVAFLRKFSRRCQQQVGYETLYEWWGGKRDDSDDRYRSTPFDTLASAEEWVENRHQEIAKARHFLATVKNTEKIIEIDLGE